GNNGENGPTSHGATPHKIGFNWQTKKLLRIAALRKHVASYLSMAKKGPAREQAQKMSSL
ncbi:MAG TPA: hypothetical protein VL793_12210, partial [Patescibacteria group bacterium]|nr:hypothetical protein [Patescibacteria group bacterium]